MACIKEFFDNNPLFPFGYDTNLYVMSLKEEYKGCRPNWIEQMKEAASNSKDLLNEFGIENDEIVDVKTFAKRFSIITDVPSSSYFFRPSVIS